VGHDPGSQDSFLSCRILRAKKNVVFSGALDSLLQRILFDANAIKKQTRFAPASAFYFFSFAASASSALQACSTI
jgi:hypothetical protein